MNNEKNGNGGGLYRYVNMSVKTADIIIAVGVLILLAVSLFLINHSGFTVNFDTNGGSQIDAVKAMYGETVEVSAEPVKEGCTFTGWYIDRECTVKWNFDTDTVTDSMTLYAGWK